MRNNEAQNYAGTQIIEANQAIFIPRIKNSAKNPEKVMVISVKSGKRAEILQNQTPIPFENHQNGLKIAIFNPENGQILYKNHFSLQDFAIFTKSDFQPGLIITIATNGNCDLAGL